MENNERNLNPPLLPTLTCLYQISILYFKDNRKEYNNDILSLTVSQKHCKTHTNTQKIRKTQTFNVVIYEKFKIKEAHFQ